MQDLGNFNLFTNHFVMGGKLPKEHNCQNVIDVLYRWLNHKDTNTSKPTSRTRFVSFPQIIELDVFKLIVTDLLVIYKNKFPYSEKSDFIEAVFSHTIHDINRFLNLNLDWAGNPHKELEYIYYYDYIGDQFLDYGIKEDIGIDYYLQYFREVISLINSIDFNIEPSFNQEINKNIIVSSSYRKDIIKAFEFMLEKDPRKHKVILDESDYNKLINWVTYYFDNNFSLPNTDPITKVNTSKGNVIFTFLKVFRELHPNKTKPNSLFELIKICFKEYRNDNIDNYKKQKEPQYYKHLIKEV